MPHRSNISPMSRHLVVIGGGQAATQTIHTARQLGFEDRITLIAAELELPYQRPPLSKQYLSGQLPKERLSLRPAAFYESRSVDVLLGRRATALDPAHSRVTLDDAATIEYSSLVIATGSRPRRLSVPGSDLAGIHYLRTIADVDAIKAEMTPGRRIVIVGGGYIGLEVAAVAARQGFAVTVLEAADRVLGRVVAPDLSVFYHDRHTREGVAIHCEAKVSAFVGEDCVTGVKTTAGERFDADLVIIGIGIVPNVELAEAAGLDSANGIMVNSEGQTPAPGIAAAGDCTRQIHPFVGAEIRLESVHNAIGQAKAAAHALVGESLPFTEIPWFWSDQYDLKLQIAGVALKYDSSVIRGDPAVGAFALYYLRDGIPIAVDCVNSPRDFMLGKKLLAARRQVPARALADTDMDLAIYCE